MFPAPTQTGFAQGHRLGSFVNTDDCPTLPTEVRHARKSLLSRPIYVSQFKLKVISSHSVPDCLKTVSDVPISR